MSATLFNISRKHKLILPDADFYTYDGNRIDSVGATPNMKTTSGNAIDKALILIENE